MDELSILSPMFDIIFKKYPRAVPDDIWDASKVLGLNTENLSKPIRPKIKTIRRKAVIDGESNQAEPETAESTGMSYYSLCATVYSTH